MADRDRYNVAIKSADMTEEMQREVVEFAKQTVETSKSDKEISEKIKDEFRMKYHGTWHCIVGRNFGCWITHEKNFYIYFYMGQIAVLLWKTG